MEKRSFRILSDEERKQRMNEKADKLKAFALGEYESFKKYVGFSNLPVLQKIEICKLRGCDARVDSIHGILQINKKFLEDKYADYLSVILYHEFTHMWDSTCRYCSLKAKQLTEYHAVQVAFGKNLGMPSVNEWHEFSEIQYVYRNYERIPVSKYLEEESKTYYYRMKYNYFHYSEDNVNNFMYNLCQRMGYSIICSKYCSEWRGNDPYDVFIPSELAEEYTALYNSLLNEEEKTEIERNYGNFVKKLTSIIKISIFSKNYFLVENDSSIDAEESFISHCKEIMQVCEEMHEIHPKGFSPNSPYLEKRFALEYFQKLYKDMQNEKSSVLVSLFNNYFFSSMPGEQEKCNEILGTIFGTKRIQDAIIEQFSHLKSVEKFCNEDGIISCYQIHDIQSFIDETYFTPPFLAALVISLFDAGHDVGFIGDEKRELQIWLNQFRVKNEN